MSETVKILALVALGLMQIIQFLVMKKNGKGVIYNPHPPGESKTCIEHTKQLAKVEEAVEGVERRLNRIENKLNGRVNP